MGAGDGQHKSFFPKADAAVLQATHLTPRTRPQDVGPIFDTQHVDEPILSWSLDAEHTYYPPMPEEHAVASVPAQPMCFSDEYLYPVMTRNERLRLTMLWYYTREILDDTELLSRLQEKVYIAQKSIGWEFVIIGLLDLNTYTRLATYGLPLAILPRRESTCAHTVNQPPGVRENAESPCFQKLCLISTDCICSPKYGGGLEIPEVTTCRHWWSAGVCWHTPPLQDGFFRYCCLWLILRRF